MPSKELSASDRLSIMENKNPLGTSVATMLKNEGNEALDNFAHYHQATALETGRRESSKAAAVMICKDMGHDL
jgi:hypothetical protein